MQGMRRNLEFHLTSVTWRYLMWCAQFLSIEKGGDHTILTLILVYFEL